MSLISAVLLGLIAGADARIIEIPGQAEPGAVEIHGVSAGTFNPDYWNAGTLHFIPDVRSPLLSPRLGGGFRNIYAPSAVETSDGWRVFYGAWDGIDAGNDRIYSILTSDFIDFGARQTVISNGDFIHVCNVNALRNPDDSFEMMCTAYPDDRDRNKPAYFSSPDGIRWNGSPQPYSATRQDVIRIDGYPSYDDADINGMNVLLREEDHRRIYFNDFRNRGKLNRATSTDGKSYTYEGVVLETPHYVNDVKRFDVDGATWYLMGLHQNSDTLWYSLSRDGMKFDTEHVLATNLGDADRYIVAHGWVRRGDAVAGFLYGAGAVPELNRNRIFARWLQLKVIFVPNDGLRMEPATALGPDRQLMPLTAATEGHFEIYVEDGITQLAITDNINLRPGRLYRLERL